MNAAAPALTLVFTDLDGTLLDHNDYSFDAALPALSYLKKNRIPLIINSSKTASEILSAQEGLGIRQPFISENGAALYVPSALNEEWQCETFSTPRQRVIDVLQESRHQSGYRFTGFNDCHTAEIAELTGLSDHAAELAARREFTEPLLWQDSAERLLEFKQQLLQWGLGYLQGGRFLCVMANGSIDKAQPMLKLAQHYSAVESVPVTTIALGDSPNDEAMLDAADIAVVIQSATSNKLRLKKPRKILHSPYPGPRGWQWAIDQLLLTNNIN